MKEETIILLDEEAHVRWTLKTFLANEKYHVISESTTAAVLRFFSELEIAALITEYWVQGACVHETVRELKKRYPETYVMILTNCSLGENEYRKIMEAGVDDFFLKPLSSERILLHLRNGLRRRGIFIEKMRFEIELANSSLKTSCA